MKISKKYIPKPGSGLATGVKVAVASELLENHPSLKAGAIAGIMAGEINAASDRSAAVISDAIAEATERQCQAEERAAQSIIASMERRADEAKRDERQKLMSQRAQAAKQLLIAEAGEEAAKSQIYQDSLKVINDEELWTIIAKAIKVSVESEPLRDSERGIPDDINRIYRTVRRMREIEYAKPHAWKYRAEALGIHGSDIDQYICLIEGAVQAVRDEYTRRTTKMPAGLATAPPMDLY